MYGENKIELLLNIKNTTSRWLQPVDLNQYPHKMFLQKPFLLLKYEFLLRERITKFLSVKNDVMFLLYTKVFPLHTTYIYNTGVEKIIRYLFFDQKRGHNLSLEQPSYNLRLAFFD